MPGSLLITVPLDPMSPSSLSVPHRKNRPFRFLQAQVWSGAGCISLASPAESAGLCYQRSVPELVHPDNFSQHARPEVQVRQKSPALLLQDRDKAPVCSLSRHTWLFARTALLTGCRLYRAFDPIQHSGQHHDAHHR